MLSEPINETNWQHHLVMTPEGYPKSSSLQNLILILRWHETFRGMLARDGKKIIIIRRPPWDHGGGEWTPRAWTDDDEIMCMGVLEYFGISASRARLNAALKVTAA